MTRQIGDILIQEVLDHKDYEVERKIKLIERIEEAVREAEGEYESMIKESPDNERVQITLMNGAGDTLELEGTEKQIEAFEAERKERNDALFPRGMSFMETARRALERGLTVKEVTTRK